MLHVLLLDNFDLLFVAQVALFCQREKMAMQTVGVAERLIHANTGIRIQPDVTTTGLQVKNLLIVDCSAETKLLTEPRIHRLVQGAKTVFAAPSVAATLARVGLVNVKTVRTVQEVSIEDMDEAGKIVNIWKKESL